MDPNMVIHLPTEVCSDVFICACKQWRVEMIFEDMAINFVKLDSLLKL